MSIVTALLNGTNLNRDVHIETPNIMTLTPGVRKGFEEELEITTNNCNTGMALVEVTRTTVTPNETFLVLVWVNVDETIDTSGDGYIVIKIDADAIDDGSGNNADGTGIATVEKVAVLPSSNYLELCSLASGVITDTRVFSTLQDNILPFGKYYAEDAEASDAYVITIPGLKELVDGMFIIFQANTANNGSATLNINALGAKEIVKNNSATLDNNDIVANMKVVLVYDEVQDKLIMVNPVANSTSLSICSQAEAEADPCTENTKAMSPLRTQQFFDVRDVATVTYVDSVKNDGKPLIIHSYSKTFSANNSAETLYETISVPAGFTAGVIHVECVANVYGYYSVPRFKDYHANLRWSGTTSKGYMYNSYDSYAGSTNIAGATSGTLSFTQASGASQYRALTTVNVTSLSAGDGNDVQITHTTTIGFSPGTNATYFYAIVTIWPA